MGRRAPGDAAEARIAVLRARGIQVEILLGDVASPTDVGRAVAAIAARLPPLRGVAHCAVVYDDAPLADMTAARLRHALAPKIAGAWHLHRETSGLPLDWFLLYSSITGILGNRMQANYCAGNAFLDALAWHRRHLGLPALAVQWGAIGDAGYLAEHDDVAEYLARRGYEPLAADEALSLLEPLLAGDRSEAVVARIDWRRLAEHDPPTAASPSFRDLVPVEDGDAPATGEDGGLRHTLWRLGESERLDRLDAYLRDKVGRVLGIAPRRLDADKPLTELGLDSVIAVELVTALNRELGFELPVVKILQGLDIRNLARSIAASLPPPAAAPAGEAIVAERVAASAAPAEVVSTAVARVVPLPVPEVRHPDGAEGTGLDYSGLDHQRWSPAQRAVRWCARGAFALATRVTADGLERLARGGPYIMAINHLSYVDAPLALTIMPRPVILLAAEWLADTTVPRWILRDLYHAIFVHRGEGDIAALEAGLAVLRAGGVLGMSPEGSRSRTGGLTAGRTGTAYLATRAGVPVVPVALWGQERLVTSWRQLTRPPIQIRVGEALHLPSGDASAAALQDHTRRIMEALALLLPPAYRGVYGSIAQAAD
jgi:1-acyl-sn-glycerol-3-phosphate acyltransferase